MFHMQTHFRRVTWCSVRAVNESFQSDFTREDLQVMDDEGSVINSSSASEKSVVILGCVSAEPKLMGCSEIERYPVGSTRRPSFSIPLAIPRIRSDLSGSLKRPILAFKLKTLSPLFRQHWADFLLPQFG